MSSPSMAPSSHCPESWSHDFQHVLTNELDVIGDPEIKDADAIVRAHKKQLLGLSLSGGGIRSATFNLGVLQALAHLRLLSRVNYLSTVSGGGYIGSWLMAWIKRRGLKDVLRGLRPEWHVQPGNSEPAQIRFLRRFSNYLTPKLGWLGADMWTVIAVYIRNLILNLLVLAAAFAFILLIPRSVALGSVELLRYFPRPFLSPLPFTVSHAVTVFAGTALVVAAWSIIWSLRHFITRRPDKTLPSVDLPDLTEWKKEEGGNLKDEKNGYFFYPAKLFDGDFILHLAFAVKEKGSCRVRLWVPIKKEAPAGPPAATIRLSDEGIIPPAPPEGVFETGEIETGGITHAPARRAEIQAGWNRLEIVSSEGRCTVRVNDLTVNAVRVKREKLGRFLRWRRRSFAIAIEDCERITFKPGKVERLESASDIGATQGQVQFRIIVPLFLAAFAATFVFGFGDFRPDEPNVMVVPMRAAAHLPPLHEVFTWWKAAVYAGLACALLTLVLRASLKVWTYLVAAWNWIRGRFVAAQTPVDWTTENDPASWFRILGETLSLGLAAAVGGVVVWAFFHLFLGKSAWEVTIWGTPALIGAFFLTIVFHIGFMGRKLGDERREWWSRVNAWMLIYALGWIAVFGLALYTPMIVAGLEKSSKWVTQAVTLGWLMSTLWGLIAARSAATGNGRSSRLTDLVATIAPYVFVIGFFIFLAWTVDAILPGVGGANINPTGPGDLKKSDPLAWNWWWMTSVTTWDALWPVAAVSVAIAAVLSLRLDINQFSMHMLYRNRLGRCYLGASNELRRAQPFTGFSPEDDFDLFDLASLWANHEEGSVPYPILNAALNLVGGKELAWQQRKAASFIFTPLFCGYDFAELPPGYCQTQNFAGRPSPVSLATAMAISGAAASPNMGYHTSPAPAFLMTVFNVRLGWWVGNPRARRWYRSGPLNVLFCLIRELFGLTSEAGSYIYLSDGGHFENLGIYELVRRRCRFIVASDAEEDHAFGFSGLGNAIEKCRADFGIDIDIDVEPVRQRSEAGHSQWHCAIGRIFYSRVDQNRSDGILVYMKSSLTGDEPTDALRYASANPEFPHQTTADQWFDESQFESYRVLGYHIAKNVFLPLGDPDAISALANEEIFLRLSQHWYPPSAPTAASFTKHTEAIIALYHELRTNDDLQFLNRDIYPEWRALFEEQPLKYSGLAFKRPEISRAQLPKSAGELKAGFYICTAMCDIFEAVYIDLHLEQEFDHPDNRGWMNFFMHWASAPMFRVMWLIGASNYGARFQSFCTRHLNLEMGCARPIVIEPKVLTAPQRSAEIAWSDEIGTIAATMLDTIWPWIGDLQTGSEILSRAARTVSAEAPNSEVPANFGKAEEEMVRANARELVSKQLNQARGNKKFPNALPLAKDEVWYGAATLLEFLRRGKSDDKFTAVWRERITALALVHAASIAERVLSKDFQTELNPTEREMIELFFIFNPGLAGSAQIVRLAMRPESEQGCLRDDNQDISFPFGFAVLAHTKWPPEAPQEPKLVYLRVQNHLRRIGLARKGLKALLSLYPNLEIDLQRMHPDANELPSEHDYARLVRIYGSVKTELGPKRLT